MKWNRIITNISMAAGVGMWMGGFASAWAGPDAVPPARPITVANVGNDFFNTMDLSIPGLAKVRELVAQKLYAEALAAWRDQFIEKIRPMNCAEFSYNPYTHLRMVNAATSSADKVVGRLAQGATPFEDLFHLSGPPETVMKIDWYPKAAKYGEGMEALKIIQCLVPAYQQARDPVYLAKWLQVADDFAVNNKRQCESLPIERRESECWGYEPRLGDGLGNASRAHELTVSLAAFAKALPDGKLVRTWAEALRPIEGPVSDDGKKLIPPDKLANIALCVLYDYAPDLIRACKGDPGIPNQRVHVLISLAAISRVLGEFHSAMICRETVERGFLNYLKVSLLTDGGDLEQSFSYNLGMGNVVRYLMRLYEGVSPLPAWLTELRAAAQRRDLLFAGLTIPMGDLPKTGTHCYKMPPAVWKDGKVRETWKATLYKKNMPAEDDPLYNPACAQVYDTLWGNGSKGRPPFVSAAFPYSGYYALRDKWDMEGLYLFFYGCRLGCGHFNEMVNSVQVAGFGRHLLVSASSATYGFVPEKQKPDLVPIDDYVGECSSYAHNTVIVDDFSQRRQQLHANRVTYQEPIQTRWHASEHFDLVEGNYRDGYGPSYGLGQHKAQATCRHRRQVIFLRDLGLWIITDRLTGDGKKHEFAQLWHFPPPFFDASNVTVNIQDVNLMGFTRDQVQVNDRKKVIQTMDTGGPNVALYHFAGFPLRYKSFYEDKYPYRGWCRVSFGGGVVPAVEVRAQWNGMGDQILVTLIEPRRGLESAVKKISNLNKDGGRVSGFRAELADGSMVIYQAAQKEARLTAEPMEMTGEGLLLVRREAHPDRGLILGCRTLALEKKARNTEESDFEFEIVNGDFKKVAPIRYPGPDQVWMGPVGGMLTEPVEVEMEYDGAAGGEIRWTLDGNEPGATALVYTGRIEVARTATVKARVFRDGKASGPVKETIYTITNLPPIPPKPDVYASDLTPESARDDGMRWQRDRTCWDASRGEGLLPIRIAGKQYEKGIGVHAEAEVVFKVKPEYQRFVAVVGLDDSTGSKGNVVLKVLADDKVLAETPVLRGTAQRFWHFDCPLPKGASCLQILTLHTPESAGYDMCDWADAGFVLRK